MSLIIGLNSGSLGSVGVTPVGATLMKTGQTTSYRTGDDGDLEAGRATDFFTLATNNPFGNTNRFTDELGGSTYANNIVIDWSTYDNIAGTVLGYYRQIIATGTRTWFFQIDEALAFSVGTFTTGWRAPNRRELDNIASMDETLTTCFNYPPFNMGTGIRIWTSTTVRNDSTQAYRYQVIDGNCFPEVKTSQVPVKGFYVRTFTVTGTTLS